MVYLTYRQLSKHDDEQKKTHKNSHMIPFMLNSKTDKNYSIRIQNIDLCGAD